MPHALEGGDDGKDVIEWGLSCCRSSSCWQALRPPRNECGGLGVLTSGGWAESLVPQVMVPELAAFGADHDRRT